jgi:hypothetical protein
MGSRLTAVTVSEPAAGDSIGSAASNAGIRKLFMELIC